MNLTKLTLLGASALLFIGCSNSPKDAVYGMYDALEDGNLEKLREHATDSTAGLLSMAATMQCSLKKSDYSNEKDLISDCLQEMFDDISIKNIEVTEVNENKAYAMVTTENKGKESVEKISLIKQDDNWKVNISK